MKLSLYFTKHFLVPPKIAGPKFETVEVEVNHPQDLICEPSGTEVLKTEWLKDGELMDFDGGRKESEYLQVNLNLWLFNLPLTIPYHYSILFY